VVDGAVEAEPRDCAVAAVGFMTACDPLQSRGSNLSPGPAHRNRAAEQAMALASAAAERHGMGVDPGSPYGGEEGWRCHSIGVFRINRPGRRPSNARVSVDRFWSDIRAELVAACTVACLASACVPIPRTVTLSPTISGTVELPDGTPLIGEPLRLSLGRADSTCTAPVLHTRTDSLGAFRFAAVRERERFTLLLFDRGFCYQICGVERGPGAAYQNCSLHTVPDSASISCVEALGHPPGVAPIQCVERRRRPRVR
jgi:hypothetical protein